MNGAVELIDQQAAESQQTGSGLGDAQVKTISSPGARLWRDSNFNIFWAGQTLDALGSSSALIIIPLLVLEATGSILQMGLITATIGLGSLLSSFASGVFVDRLDRRKIMIFSDIGRAVFYSLIPISWWLMGKSLWPIYLITAIAAYLTTFFTVAYNTAIPNLVDQSQITDANGRLQATAALAFIAGPILAGFASRLDPAVSVGIVSLSYLISALLMLLVRLRKTPVTSECKGAIAESSRFKESLAGVRFLLRHPVLKPVTLLVSLFILASGATLDLSIFRLKHDLRADDHIVGTVFGLASIGAVLGGMFAPAMRRRWGFGFCFLTSMALTSVAIALIGLMPDVRGVAAMAIAFTFGTTVRTISSMSVRQQVTPDHLLGRVSSAFLSLIIILGPIGTIAGTLVAQTAGTPFALLMIGALGLVLTIIGLFTAANTRRPEDVSAQAQVLEADCKPPVRRGQDE